MEKLWNITHLYRSCSYWKWWFSMIFLPLYLTEGHRLFIHQPIIFGVERNFRAAKGKTCLPSSPSAHSPKPGPASDLSFRLVEARHTRLQSENTSIGQKNRRNLRHGQFITKIIRPGFWLFIYNACGEGILGSRIEGFEQQLLGEVLRADWWWLPNFVCSWFLWKIRLAMIFLEIGCLKILSQVYWT